MLEAKLVRKDSVIAEISLGSHDVRDQIVDFVREWPDKTDIIVERFIRWLGIHRAKFFSLAEAVRQGQRAVNEHNCHVPRDNWITDEERRAIIAFRERFPLEGYWRLTFMDDRPRRRVRFSVDHPTRAESRRGVDLVGDRAGRRGSCRRGRWCVWESRRRRRERCRRGPRRGRRGPGYLRDPMRYSQCHSSVASG